MNKILIIKKYFDRVLFAKTIFLFAKTIFLFAKTIFLFVKIINT
jgi:hypothetical protein